MKRGVTEAGFIIVSLISVCICAVGFVMQSEVHDDVVLPVVTPAPTEIQMVTPVPTIAVRQASSFLVFVVHWYTEVHDVDLEVVDPLLENHSPADDRDSLRITHFNGPGTEMLEIEDAEPGEYRVFYRLRNRHGNPENALVRGWVISPTGTYRLPDVTLADDSGALVAWVNLDVNTNVAIRSQQPEPDWR